MTSPALRREIDRAVTPAELHDALNRPIPRAEVDEVLSLRRWFTTRYRSAEERLAYVRQAYNRWQATLQRSTGVQQ